MTIYNNFVDLDEIMVDNSLNNSSSWYLQDAAKDTQIAILLQRIQELEEELAEERAKVTDGEKLAARSALEDLVK